MALASNGQVLKDLALSSLAVRKLVGKTASVTSLEAREVDTALLTTDILEYGNLVPPVNTRTLVSGPGEHHLEKSGTVTILDNVPKTIVLPDLSVRSDYQFDIGFAGDLLFRASPTNVTTLVADSTHLYVACQNGALFRVILSTGSLDTSWTPNVSAQVDAAALDTTNRLLYIGGSFTNVGGLSFNRVARVSLDAPGLVDTTWNPDANSTVVALSLDMDNSHVYLGGSFSAIGGVTFNRLARIPFSSAVADPTWNPNVSSTVNDIRLDADNSFVYLSGTFTTIGGVGFNRIARIPFSSATADVTWNPNANNTVFRLALDFANSLVYAGGSFTTLGGVTFNRLARIPFSSAVADATWNPDVGGTVNNLTLDLPNSRIYLGAGTFVSIGGIVYNRIARISFSTPVADASWNPNLNSSVNAIVVDAARGVIYAGGVFTATNNVRAPRLVKLFEEPLVLKTFSSAQLMNGELTEYAIYSAEEILQLFARSQTEWGFTVGTYQLL